MITAKQVTTSVIGLRGDRRSVTLGLLSVGVLVGVIPEESVSFPPVFTTRDDRGVAGEVLCGASEGPFLKKPKAKTLIQVMLKKSGPEQHRGKLKFNDCNYCQCVVKVHKHCSN